MARSRTPQPPAVRNGSPPKAEKPTKKVAKNKDYTSDGVDDNDVFLLPFTDFQVMILVTVVGAVVRLFRIYQPTSVVFDEVQ